VPRASSFSGKEAEALGGGAGLRVSVVEVLLVIFIAIAISAIIGAALFLGLRIAPNVGWVDVAVAWGFITLTSVGARYCST
jgi:steroid 5-alpha reductase family enzyme